MPDYIAAIPLGTAAAFLTFIAAVIVGAVKVLKEVFSLWGKVRDLVDDLQGEPARPGVPARKGAMDRLLTLENNGGSSLKDAIDRIERAVGDTQASLSAHLAQSDRTEAAVWAALRDNTDRVIALAKEIPPR